VRGVLVSVCFSLERAIPAGSADAYVLRYGDPNANPPPAAEKDLFAFWDGFDEGATTIDTNRWNVNGNVVVGGGVASLPGGGVNAIASKAATDAVGALASFEIRVRITDPASAPGTVDSGEQFYYWFGFQHKGDFLPTEPWSIFTSRSPNSFRAGHKSTTGACTGNCADPNERPQSTAFRTYRIDRALAETYFVTDEGALFRAAGTNGDESIIVRNFMATSDVVVDWVRARPIVDPPPTIDLSAEEPAPP